MPFFPEAPTMLAIATVKKAIKHLLYLRKIITSFFNYDRLFVKATKWSAMPLATKTAFLLRSGIFREGKKICFFAELLHWVPCSEYPKLHLGSKIVLGKEKVKFSNFVWHSVHSFLATDLEMTGVDLACVPVGIDEIVCKFWMLLTWAKLRFF